MSATRAMVQCFATEPNTAAWVQTLAELTKSQRESRPLAVALVEKALVIQTGTQSVERYLGEVAKTEQKNRAEHLSHWNLARSIKLNLQNLQGPRSPKVFQPQELFRGAVESMQRSPAVQYRASEYGIQVQNHYRSFFGTKALASRALVGKPDRSSEKPHLGNMRQASQGKQTVVGEKRKHDQAVAAVVSASPAASSSSWQPLVDAQKDVACAREAVAATMASQVEKRAVETMPGPSGSGKRARLAQEADECLPEDAEDPAAGSQDHVAAAISANEKLALKKAELAKATPAGACIPYMDTKGGVFKSSKLPSAEPASRPAPDLPDLVRIWASSNSISVPIWRRYRSISDFSEAHAILVENLQDGILTPAGLLARLWGTRLVDRKWVYSKMKEGICIAFACALQFHLYLHVHESFRDEHKEHADRLLSSSALFAKRSAVRKQCLFAEVSPFPERPKHPRLTYEVVGQARYSELAAEAKAQGSRKNMNQILNLEGLLRRLTEVLR